MNKDVATKRREEILSACENLYQSQGLNGLNIKRLASLTSLSRPSIYVYFKTKEEILLALLLREYEKLNADLLKIKKGSSKEDLAASLAKVLARRELLWRIVNMNLSEIEENATLERLAKLKTIFARTVSILVKILEGSYARLTEDEARAYALDLITFLFGAYPFVHHSQKQLAAMQMAQVHFADVSFEELSYRFLLRLLPSA